MRNANTMPILSRLAPDEFFGRERELDRVFELATAMTGRKNAVLLGGPRTGKTEIMRTTFDRLFNDQGDIAPFYYCFNPERLDPETLSVDYLSQFLAQFIAFRRGDARTIALGEGPLQMLPLAASPKDYAWIREATESFQRAVEAGDKGGTLRAAIFAPTMAATRTGSTPFVLLDNFHLLASATSGTVRGEITAAMLGRHKAGYDQQMSSPGYLLTGLRRSLVEMFPPDEDFFDKLELVQIGPMPDEHLERMISSLAVKLGAATSESTTELMIQQLKSDLFYIRALITAAASKGLGIKSFMEFERVYTGEVLGGRIGHYLDALLRDVAPDARSRRAALEILALAVETDAPIPLEAVLGRAASNVPASPDAVGRPNSPVSPASPVSHDADTLLARLHAREFLETSFGFVKSSGDPVLADYVRARYRSEIAGMDRALSGDELLGEKLKESYRLMMSRYNRAIESQLIELLARFDFQSVPASMFDLWTFSELYGGMSRVQIRRSLDDENEKVRLPQVVLVTDLGSGHLTGMSWRGFAASGFEGGIYSEANEVMWLITLVNSKEPLDLETLRYIDQYMESGARRHARELVPLSGSSGGSGGTRTRSQWPPRVVRWYISKEGFSAASASPGELSAYRSNYTQLDMLYDYLSKLVSDDEIASGSSEFELVIPIEGDSELIAARTVEQIARTADFDQESINQIKTALIEACINASEHSDSPDRRIYQRFLVSDDRLVITVSNKGKQFAPVEDMAATAVSGSVRRGRGLQIIRALMDQVRFEQTDDGSSLVMTKFRRQ